MEMKITVFYAGVNVWNVDYFEELIFDTEEEADRFINKIKNRTDVNRITKTISWKFASKNW